jgi:hypothetical protein
VTRHEQHRQTRPQQAPTAPAAGIMTLAEAACSCGSRFQRFGGFAVRTDFLGQSGSGDGGSLFVSKISRRG